MALIAARLNAGVILVVTVQRWVCNLPLPSPPHPLPPFSQPLVSLMVSVDVKHHVCFTFTTEKSRWNEAVESTGTYSDGSVWHINARIRSEHVEVSC